MLDDLPDFAKESQDSSEPNAGQTRLEYSGEFVVKHHPTPPKAPGDKQIHPRRRLPLVPEKRQEETEGNKKDG